MSIRDIFSKTKKRAVIIQAGDEKAFPEGLMMKCPECRKIHLSKEIEQNLKVCPSCQHHLKMTAYERVAIFIDKDTFVVDSFKPYDIIFEGMIIEDIATGFDEQKEIEFQRKLEEEKQVAIAEIKRLKAKYNL